MKMKKILLGVMLTGSLLVANTFAQIGLGYSKGDSSDNFITAFGSIKVLSNIDLRLEYTKNVSENPEFSKEDISRYGLFATYTLPLAANFSITPKIGLAKTDGSFTFNDTFKRISDSSTEFTYGIEANYQMNDNISLFVGYTDYGNKLKLKELDSSQLDTKNYTFGIKIDI